MKEQFEKVKELAIKLHNETGILDSMIDKRWGFNPSDKDLDEIIDTLDYGTGNISYKEFVWLMDKEKKEDSLKP